MLGCRLILTSKVNSARKIRRVVIYIYIYVTCALQKAGRFFKQGNFVEEQNRYPLT